MVERLDIWLSKQERDKFPRRGVDYLARLQNVREYLVNEVYPHVTALALENGYLTDHGEQHVVTVIERASQLAPPGNCSKSLSAYETYLLLMAIYFHDVGNIYGRSGHESHASQVLQNIRPLVGNDTAELRMIIKIADAHGGKTETGDKDKISKLEHNAPVLNFPVRPKLLAAILRFADELSDDTQRAARFLLDSNTIDENSRLYHAYADSLQSVVIDPPDKTIALHFQVSGDRATERFRGEDGDIFLIDEIWKRSLKMYAELSYCMRFTGDIVRIDMISVKVEVFLSLATISPCTQFSYRLQESGYPDHCLHTPNSYLQGDRMTGQAIAEILQGISQ